MALIKCKECGQQMSSGAKACPHCGKRRTSRAAKGCLWIVIVFGVAVGFGIYKTGQQHDAADARRAAMTPQQVADEAAAEFDAKLPDASKALCLKALKQSLNDPDSAKFDAGNWSVSTEGNYHYTVLATFRAKNQMGAYVLTDWRCRVVAEGTKVQLLSLQQIAP